MRKPRRAPRAVGPLLGVVLLTACGNADGAPQQEPSSSPSSSSRPSASKKPERPAATVSLQVDRTRQSSGVVASGGQSAPYNYGPTVLQEGGRYRVWWCSQLPGAGPAGDDVLHAESTSPDGPFAAAGGAPAVPVFSGSGGGFDGMHTCDPSVIKVDGTYYLYYTGAASDDHAHGNAIGVASSPDGLTWTRLANGQPIVTPAEDTVRKNAYGAGQPSALYLDGWFYLMFTDTSAKGAGWNGAGQFVLRAKDPAFRTEVQALGETGFAGVGSTRTPRARSIVDAFSADWMWVDALDAFAIAHQTEQGTTITFWDRDFTRHPYQPLVIRGPWREGPGLVRRPDGHAPVSREDPCGRVPIDVLRATRTVSVPQEVPTDLARFGLDVHGVNACRERGRAAEVLEGFAVPSPERTVDLVVGGAFVRVERRSVAATLAVRILDHRPPALEELPVTARMSAGVPAVRAPGRPLGMLLDDGRLWLVGSDQVAALNSSPVSEVSEERWRQYPTAPNLAAQR
ncbi:glycoside hydrolase family protein [Streptoalloteichus hindustanus]|uniref:Glycosyl hydrolases family 43 n=1 Tax=Streptoalloteichus hindustanus TaxID=2017 RepID=A0A1M5HEM0_STRHI|nr:beta-xylosidase [Streptoalloteichus hindustanus]SHG14384.1 hypothetical protein SAMN05444320_106530 [Streptoalloteichus hindustanus]